MCNNSIFCTDESYCNFILFRSFAIFQLKNIKPDKFYFLIYSDVRCLRSMTCSKGVHVSNHSKEYKRIYSKTGFIRKKLFFKAVQNNGETFMATVVYL